MFISNFELESTSHAYRYVAGDSTRAKFKATATFNVRKAQMEPLDKHVHFLVEPNIDYFCSICIDPMTEPYLTDCGHHFCYTCRGRLLASGKPECPECREQDVLTDARLNKHLQRQVNSLKVRCQHHEVGCQWVGELRYLQEHLDPVIRKCGFILLACPLGCGERVRGSAMKDHIMYDCCKRSSECEHCGYCNKFDIVTEQHYPVCEQFPVECPNVCSVEHLKRIELASHLEEQCPLQVIQCPFTSAGCTVQLPRREMEEHEDKAMQQHLRMMMSMLKVKQEKPAAVTTNQPHFLFNLVPVEFAITDFTKKKECDAKWISPPFYSHPQGYKFRLAVFPNGLYTGCGTHVSLCVLLLEGEYDDHLDWPVDASIVVDLIDWGRPEIEESFDIEQGLDLNSANNLVTKKGIKRSLIYSQFFPHSSLSYNSTTNTEYLQNDCVRLRVSKVILYSTALLNKTPSWQNPHNGYQSLHEFTLTDFSKRLVSSNIHYSSSFYTHQRYKFCLVVKANSEINEDESHSDNEDEEEHISVHVRLMAGEYDDQLEWPFVGQVSVELLNWREDKAHIRIIFVISANDGLDKVTKGVFGEIIGSQLIAHSMLTDRRQNAAEYLQEDCLRFRVRNIN